MKILFVILAFFLSFAAHAEPKPEGSAVLVGHWCDTPDAAEELAELGPGKDIPEEVDCWYTSPDGSMKLPAMIVTYMKTVFGYEIYAIQTPAGIKFALDKAKGEKI